MSLTNNYTTLLIRYNYLIHQYKLIECSDVIVISILPQQVCSPSITVL